jgi:hypothetical protein
LVKEDIFFPSLMHFGNDTLADIINLAIGDFDALKLFIEHKQLLIMKAKMLKIVFKEFACFIFRTRRMPCHVH